MTEPLTTAVRARLDRLACLAGRSWRAEPLPGGLTNDNLRVLVDPPSAGSAGSDGSTGSDASDDGLDLVVRLFGSDAGLLGIDRDAEHVNSLRAAEAGVGAPVVEYRPDLACLVIGYLPGRTLDDATLAEPAVLGRAADAVRRLHAGPAFEGTFDMAARQAAYVRVVRERGFTLPPTYDDHADAWAQVVRALAVSPPAPAPCNNDLLAANFIDDGTRVHLIDYEYSGTNDPFFELGNTATECGFDDDTTDAWLGAYLDRAPTAAERARIRLQSVASEYGWSLWGFIQAATSPLDFDFKAWGRERFEKAEATFCGPLFTRLLEDVTRG